MLFTSICTKGMSKPLRTQRRRGHNNRMWRQVVGYGDEKRLAVGYPPFNIIYIMRTNAIQGKNQRSTTMIVLVVAPYKIPLKCC